MTALVALLALGAVVVGAFGAWRGLSGLPHREKHRSVDDGDGPFLFPAGFLWGAATSDQQIEHQQPSDWTEMENRAHAARASSVGERGSPLPGHIKGIHTVTQHVLQRKTDFDRLFPEDLARASSMGHNAHRFSISWARLFPDENTLVPDAAGIDFYGRILDECQRCSLVPFLTLHHFALPAWLSQPSGGRRGVERDDAPDRFAHFAESVAHAFGGRVRFWCTINEPMVVAYQGYLDGAFPPNEKRKGPNDVVDVVDGLLKMHARAYRAIHEDAERRKSAASVGIAHHIRAFMPWREHNLLDRITASTVDKMFVLDFLDAIHTGTLRMSGRTIPGLAGSMDYVGVNFYGRAYVKTKVTAPAAFDVLFNDENDRGDEPSDLGWSADEAAFTSTLARFHKRYARPLFVLENGTAEAAEDDVRRQRALVRHTQALWRAVNHHGADVRGYFHWSLIDNFEWAEGFGPRFGLYAVDYENDFARRPRKSVDVYKQIASQNALPAELWRRFRR